MRKPQRHRAKAEYIALDVERKMMHFVEPTTLYSPHTQRDTDKNHWVDFFFFQFILIQYLKYICVCVCMNTVNCECEHGKCYANESQSTTRKRAWERLRENIFFYFSFRLVLLLLLSAFFFLHNSVYIFMCYVYMLSIDNMCWLVLIMKLVAFRMRFALFQYLLIVLSWLIVYLRGRWEGEPACGLFECERESKVGMCAQCSVLYATMPYMHTQYTCVCVCGFSATANHGILHVWVLQGLWNTYIALVFHSLLLRSIWHRC